MKRIALSVLICSLASAASYQVVDSRGKVIGQVVGVMQRDRVIEVAILVNGQPLIVDVFRLGFRTDSLLFTTSDCTGQAYLDASSGLSPFPVTVVSGDNKLYAESGAGQAILALSVLDPINGCFQQGQFYPDAVPVKQVLDLNVFKTPFKVRPQRDDNNTQ